MLVILGIIIFLVLGFLQSHVRTGCKGELKNPTLQHFFCEQIKATLDGLMRVWPQHGRRVIDGLLVLCRNMVLN